MAAAARARDESPDDQPAGVQRGHQARGHQVGDCGDGDDDDDDDDDDNYRQGDNWGLVIQSAQERDSASYLCQVTNITELS